MYFLSVQEEKFLAKFPLLVKKYLRYLVTGHYLQPFLLE